MLRNIGNLLNALKFFREVYKTGGYSSYKITTVRSGSILKGKKILITGGSTGIGLSMAEKFISEGAIVVATGRNANALGQASELIPSTNFRTIVWDVADSSKRELLFNKSIELLGGDVDVLINNAGVIDTKEFALVGEEEWDSIYDVNSKGVFFLTQCACKFWLDTKKKDSIKKVINISSQGGFVGATYPYRLTKWDVAGLTQGLGVKFARDGILVNGIAPGIVATKMQPKLADQENNMFCPHNPLRRFAIPEEIAELASFMASDASNFIVGQTILCDGGYSIK